MVVHKIQQIFIESLLYIPSVVAILSVNHIDVTVIEGKIK